MEDPRWLRLITIGLVLAALAVGYFLISGRFTTKTTKSPASVEQAVKKSPQPTQTPEAVLGQNTQATTPSAYTRIAERTRGGVQTLPKTGFPAGLAIVFSVSAIISGWSLRKYPN